ncbi:hypothetical protein AAHC03_024292 [Spirometra sp. Aus1]
MAARGKSQADPVAGGENCAVSLETLHTNTINCIALHLLQSKFPPGRGGDDGRLARQTLTRQSDNRGPLSIAKSALNPFSTHCPTQASTPDLVRHLRIICLSCRLLLRADWVFQRVRSSPSWSYRCVLHLQF